MWNTFFDTAKFAEAVAWFRERVPMTDAEFQTVSREAQKRAFLVSGVAQLDLVTEVWEALDKALVAGTTIQDFKKTVGERLATTWGGDNPLRLETIFRTNMQHAYSAGRYEQMTHPDVLSDRPVWMYDAVYDSRTSPICKACDNVRLPADDPWWKTHMPPLHFNCRSAITTMSEEEAEEAGGLSKPPSAAAAEGFGATPQTGKEWAPNEKDYPPELWKRFQRTNRVSAERRASATRTA